MPSALMRVIEASARIRSGVPCVVAGAEELLRQLPRGNWIGGTTVHFMTDAGGREDHAHVFVSELRSATDLTICHYGADALADFTRDRWDHGLSFALIPGFSQAHHAFGVEAAEIPGLFDQPLLGWITAAPPGPSPKVVDGATGTVHDDGALMMHLQLPAGTRAQVDIVTPYSVPADSPTIQFPRSGFFATTAQVNGVEVDFAAYLRERDLDLRAPLAACYAGAPVNVSFRNVDDEGVSFFAAVQAGVVYRHARTPDDLAGAVMLQGGPEPGDIAFNCMLNYSFGRLEGRDCGGYIGPITYGEIAYILLNQSLVRLRLSQDGQVRVA